MRSLQPEHDETLEFAEANATLRRILGAIEEYVYTGEFLRSEGAYRLIFAGPCRERFLGLTADEARTAVWAHYVHPEDVGIFEAAHERAISSSVLDVQYRMVGADGVVRWVRDRGRIRHDHPRYFLDGSVLDVTAVRTSQRELEAARADADRLAHMDPLTGLANRRSLPERLTRLTTTRGLGVLAVDVDHFKHINDFFGHASGDGVLTELAKRLQDVTRTGDELVRMGGEEFLVLLPEVRDEVALLEVAEAVRDAVSAEPMTVDGERIPVTVSVGAASATRADADGDRLLSAADAGLYDAKRAGRNRVRLAGTSRAVPGDEDDVDEQSHTLHVATTLAAVTGALDTQSVTAATTVSLLAARITRRLGGSSAQVLRCRLAGLALDLGYLRLPQDVLTTPGPLSEEARALVRRHPVHSQQLVEAVPELRSLSLIVRHHHERWDGEGYPDRLQGTDIPLESRILAVADAWHAMSSPRPHRPARSPTAAEAELDRAAGSQFDPEVVRALRSVLLNRRDHDSTAEPLSAAEHDGDDAPAGRRLRTTASPA